MQMSTQKDNGRQATPAERAKGVRILAKSIFRELSQQGYDERQIVALATELISEVTTRMGPQTKA